MEISAEERKRREIRRSHYENKFKPQCNTNDFERKIICELERLAN